MTPPQNKQEGHLRNPQVTGLTRDVIEWISRVMCPAILAASEAAKKAKVKLSSQEIFPKGINNALGPLKALIKPTVAGHQAACPRLFVYGKCTVKQCRSSHKLTREPSHGAMKQYTDWVERRATALKEKHPKV